MLTRLLVITGGQSHEHPVSLKSARTVLQALKAEPISASVLIITKSGRWLDSVSSQEALLAGRTEVVDGGEPAPPCAQWHEDYDVVFPLVHGTTGEDGGLQGFLQILNLPYIGCSVLASAVCMDKPTFKGLASSYGFSQTRFIAIRKSDFHENEQATVERVARDLSLPWVAKPADLGSSFGVESVKDRAGAQEAFQKCFTYCQTMVVEETVSNLLELEIGIIGKDAPRASVVAQIEGGDKVYDYETKYGGKGSTVTIPAEIPHRVAEKCRSMALQAFRRFGCTGYARVDFFYDRKSEQLLLNEINTIPGFTETSTFPQFWESEGMSCGRLVMELVELALAGTDRSKANGSICLSGHA